jgi:hypothetical protein
VGERPRRMGRDREGAAATSLTLVGFARDQEPWLSLGSSVSPPGGASGRSAQDVRTVTAVFKVLMEDCGPHTVLRLGRGTFSPYSEGTNTNVIFFTTAIRSATTDAPHEVFVRHSTLVRGE